MSSVFLPDSIAQLYPKIPSDWNWKKITSICNPKQWSTISQEQMTSIGYPVYGANGIVGYFSQFNHEQPTIAISCRGACGDIHLTQPKSYVTGNAMCLDDLVEDTDQSFFYYALQYRTLKDAISGSAQPQITRENLKGVFLPFPEKREQQKIAEILTSVDEVIENTQSQINKLEDLKKATMNELLTKGIGHTEFKDTEIGRIPKDWRIGSLEQLVDQNRPITYGIVQTGEHIPDGVPCIRVVDIVRMKPDINRMIRTTHDISNSYRRTILKTDDILFALRGEIGFVYKVNAYLEGANLTRGVALISSSDGVSSNFLVWALRGKLCRQQILDGVNGSALQEIPLGNLRGIKVPVPCEDEQNHIFQVLSSIEMRISQTQNTINKVGILKQSLMQDLLTGKVRVTVN